MKNEETVPNSRQLKILMLNNNQDKNNKPAWSSFFEKRIQFWKI